jgi:membrane-associated protein
MELLRQFIDLFLHLDTHLAAVIQSYGTWTYVILFVIIFCETGLVVTPFLPGDSLLFAGGAFVALGSLSLVPLLLLLIVAAILGDAVNYSIGRRIGAGLLAKPDSRVFKRAYVDRTHAFYEKYGPKTIVIARFVPIVRTFAPFLAGVGKMSYSQFVMFNISGAVLWVVSCVFAGFFFGNLPFVRDNFTLVIFAIIGISLLPAMVAFLQERRKPRDTRSGPATS